MTREELLEEIAKLCYQFCWLIDDKDIGERWRATSNANRERWRTCAHSILALIERSRRDAA